MVDAAAGDKLKVFISYSRKDSAAFADELMAGLEYGGFSPFLDRHDIAGGEEWEARLGGLIAQSDTVVFVVSPEAVKSERCVWEVDRTIELSKRLVPVIFKSVPEHEIPKTLSRLQFVRFDTGRGITRPLAELAEALRQDLDWIREHTRLGEIATRWDRRGCPETLLLRGDEIEAAKAWIAARKADASEITDAQQAFISASEEAEAARLGKERAQLEAIGRAQDATAQQQRRAARLQRRVWWLLGGVAALVLAMVGYLTWLSYDLAGREINVFTARATEAMNEGKFDRAMRYALQAYPARGRLPWVTPFSTELEAKLAGGAQATRLQLVLKGHSLRVQSAAFSTDGKWVVTASEDTSVRIWDAESGKEIAILKSHTFPLSSAAFSGDGRRVATASRDYAARIWDVTWATLMHGDDLRERVCAEKLFGAAQEFTDGEIDDDPILRGIDKDDPVARNPCLRRGPLSLDYWTRLPGQLWRSMSRLVGVN
jgi:TIR domain/WD domain, G-beta repeat